MIGGDQHPWYAPEPSLHSRAVYLHLHICGSCHLCGMLSTLQPPGNAECLFVCLYSDTSLP